MGYYSCFNIGIQAKKEFSIEEVTGELLRISGYDLYDFAEYPLSKEGNVYHFEVEFVTWYSYTENFVELSKIFPELIFFVSRLGEDNTDYTEQVFKNGEVEEKQLTLIYPEWETSSEYEEIFEQYRPQQF